MYPPHWPLAFYVNPTRAGLEAEVAWLHEHGIRHMGSNGMPGDDWTNIKRMAGLLEKYDMRMVSLHGEIGLLSPDGDDDSLRERHLRVLERARAWQADAVVVHFRSTQQPWHDGVWFDESLYIQTIGLQAFDDRMARMVDWLCSEAAKVGTAIAVENIPIHFAFGYRVDEIAALVRRVGAPNLGICLDSGHAHLSGLDVSQAVRDAGKTLWTTHFHDCFNNEAPRGSLPETDLHLVPGLGTIHWPAVLKALREVEFSAPIVFEGPRLPGQQEPYPAWELTMNTWRAFEVLAGLAA